MLIWSFYKVVVAIVMSATTLPHSHSHHGPLSSNHTGSYRQADCRLLSDLSKINIKRAVWSGGHWIWRARDKAGDCLPHRPVTAPPSPQTPSTRGRTSTLAPPWGNLGALLPAARCFAAALKIDPSDAMAKQIISMQCRGRSTIAGRNADTDARAPRHENLVLPTTVGSLHRCMLC